MYLVAFRITLGRQQQQQVNIWKSYLIFVAVAGMLPGVLLFFINCYHVETNC
jgi:hypothetical protein